MIDKTQFLTEEVKRYSSAAQAKAFAVGLTGKPVSGILLNKSAFEKETFVKVFPQAKQDPDDPLLFRFDKETLPLGKSLFHFGGGGYILDPSSATISLYLAPLLSEKPLVMDLAAAPGGKSIALALRRQDCLIVANDYSYSRALEIPKNTDRLGLSSILALSLDPQTLALPPLFDAIILDAPCSGSGMIRKNPAMLDDWSEEKVNRLLPLQEALLEKASSLLQKDGILAYSTCSLSSSEDEDQIERFLKRHPEFENVSLMPKATMIKGRHGLGIHLIPGVFDGEGIYFCFLRKKDGKRIEESLLASASVSPVPGLSVFSCRKNEYLLPRMYGALAHLPFLTPGIKIHNDEPHPKCAFDHAYSKVALGLPFFELTPEEARSYASGEEVRISSVAPDGLGIAFYQGLRLGFGKKIGNRLKNYLPKGLRFRCDI